MLKVYAVWVDTWYDCSDNGRDQSNLVGLYATKELAIEAFEREGKKLFGNSFSYQMAMHMYENVIDNESNYIYGEHTGISMSEESIHDAAASDNKTQHIICIYEE